MVCFWSTCPPGLTICIKFIPDLPVSGSSILNTPEFGLGKLDSPGSTRVCSQNAGNRLYMDRHHPDGGITIVQKIIFCFKNNLMRLFPDVFRFDFPGKYAAVATGCESRLFLKKSSRKPPVAVNVSVCPGSASVAVT